MMMKESAIGETRLPRTMEVLSWHQFCDFAGESRRYLSQALNNLTF